MASIHAKVVLRHIRKLPFGPGAQTSQTAVAGSRKAQNESAPTHGRGRPATRVSTFHYLTAVDAA